MPLGEEVRYPILAPENAEVIKLKESEGVPPRVELKKKSNNKFVDWKVSEGGNRRVFHCG